MNTTLAQTPSPTAVALIELDTAAKTYSTARADVSERVANLDAALREIYRRHMPGLRKAIAVAKTAQDAAAAAVERHPDMFKKPRTMVLHGITLGFKKGAGKIDWDCDDDVLVQRIEKLFKGDETTLGLLIITEKKPAKDALKALDAKDLAKLGVTIDGVGDFVIVSEDDSAGKKLVKRILKEGAIHEVQEAA